jgi:hypothetical protein
MIAMRFWPMTSVVGTDGVELYEFPASRDVPQLGWLGPDYTSTVGSNLGAGLREQDVGTELIAVKCGAPPQLEATVKGSGTRDVISGWRGELAAAIRRRRPRTAARATACRHGRTTVIDLHSRKVVGHAVADHLRTSPIIEALAAQVGDRNGIGPAALEVGSAEHPVRCR